MNETPRANRIHIAFFGLRNAGKSTLVNAFTGQNLAIVSDTPGTTTDPVSKAMEILPLGPCLITDTAGLDDVGELGEQRVAKTLAVLAATDVAVWVRGEEKGEVGQGERSRSTEDGKHPLSTLTFGLDLHARFLSECRKRNVTVLEYRRGESVEELKTKIASLKIVDDTPGLLDGLVSVGDRVICVCPIDESAPKGRLILPQVQVIRAALDLHATCDVCQPQELGSVLAIDDAAGTPRLRGRTLVVTDSQAFGEVNEILKNSRLMSPDSCPARAGEVVRQEARDLSCRRETEDVTLTSFSILFARQKGDLGAYVKGLAALKSLRDGDTVLVAEGCTHHRQCNDIGTVKIPKAVAKLSGKTLNFVFASGGDFDLSPRPSSPALIVQCGGCMLTRREVLRRIGLAREAGIPIVNYGMVLAAANGIEVASDCCCLASSASGLASRVSRPREDTGLETRDAKRPAEDARHETTLI